MIMTSPTLGLDINSYTKHTNHQCDRTKKDRVNRLAKGLVRTVPQVLNRQ